MSFFKNHLFASVIMGALLFCACSDDSDPAPIIEEPDPIAPSKVYTTAFTAQLTAQYNGVSKIDIALGRSGILYCPKTDNAEAIFKSWKDGNVDAECIVSNKGKAVGETYEGLIFGLDPDTEYSYCFYLKNRENTTCDLSAVSTFKTTALEPRYSYFKASQIQMFSAKLRGTAVIDYEDMEYCQSGMLYSDSENGSLENMVGSYISYSYDQNGNKTISFDTEIEFTVNYLKPGTDYWFRSFITYTSQDGEEHVVYGPEYSFTTKPVSDKWAVDLGLPSGIRWASCPLGRSDFDDPYDFIFANTFSCFWGSTKNNTYTETYEYLDTINNTYTDIGSNIEGTQYDIAHAILGGKWRLPTKEDVEELIQYCNIGKPRTAEYEYRTENSITIYHTNVAAISGPNGRYFKTHWGYTWTGTLSENVENAYYAAYGYDMEKDSAYIELAPYPRDMTMNIHPVWDPNMP